MAELTPDEALRLKRDIVALGQSLGFQALGVAHVELSLDEERLGEWLARGWHGQMDYMQRHGTRRTRPAELIPGTLSVISARMNYWPEGSAPALGELGDPRQAYVSRYALGRDYHKLLRRRLAQLAERIAVEIGEFGYRVFVDSAPVLEKPLARAAGLGWVGKHTNLLSRDAGSYFFLGEIYTDLPLPADTPVADLCGSCTRCLDACPTNALPAPYQLDARRCISYLTIEHFGGIPEALRPALGNRIYGCDDCQLVCPWNKYAQLAGEPDFRARHRLDTSSLIELFAWEEPEFLARTKGSAIRRIGHVRWLRNIAVALGNAPADPAIILALETRREFPDEVVREHVAWALARQRDGHAPERFPSALERPEHVREPG
jgi:epoxyqueuosine reductase